MNTFKVYIRFRGHIVHKYESALNSFDASCQALRYFKNGSIQGVIQLKT